MKFQICHQNVDFIGEVVAGLGNHAKLVIPGRHELYGAPPEWPNCFFPGSLNVRVCNLEQIFMQFGVRKRKVSLCLLDADKFIPYFTIAHHLIGNNTLQPKFLKPRRGTAKLWRAVVHCNSKSHSCFVMRRIGSHMLDTLELISTCSIRGKLELPPDKNWPARCTISFETKIETQMIAA